MVKALTRRTAPHIAVIDGQPTTTSRDIAETFGKRHDHVLERIRKLDCSPEFSAPNFRAAEYVDAKGEQRTEYRITRDGFAFLCMGFTGAKAAQWKERYIHTFNKMAEKLAAKPAPRPALAKTTTRPGITLALMLDGPIFTAEQLAAIDTRAFEINTTSLPHVRQWLHEQVRKNCIDANGTVARHFAATLANADFAAFSTMSASRYLDTATKLLQFLHDESAVLMTQLQAKRTAMKGNTP